MEWTNKAPTEPGFYWFRGHNHDDPRIVEVLVDAPGKYSGTYRAGTIIQPVVYVLTDKALSLGPNALWAGPISMPGSDAGENEDLSKRPF